MNIDNETQPTSYTGPTPTPAQAKILESLNSGLVIRSERLNSATKYHHVLTKSGDKVPIRAAGFVHRARGADVELDGDEVSQAALERMVANKWVSGRIKGAGMAPPIEYTITDTGRRALSAYDMKPAARGNRR